MTAVDGELASKDVTISAQVLTPDRQVISRRMVVTLERAELKGEGRDRRGRWIVTSISGAA
ncbi:MAG: hypothetical protein LC804_25975 [Acidobacteria bacterium]|nr:hypothetical protein [Acidobacteriota bacterium]